jgi:hypothetical protein
MNTAKITYAIAFAIPLGGFVSCRSDKEETISHWEQRIKQIEIASDSKAEYSMNIDDARALVDSIEVDVLLGYLIRRNISAFTEDQSSLMCESVLLRSVKSNLFEIASRLLPICELRFGVRDQPLEWWAVTTFGIDGVEMLDTARRKASRDSVKQSLELAIKRTFWFEGSPLEEETTIKFLMAWFDSNKARLTVRDASDFTPPGLGLPGKFWSPLEINRFEFKE